jgi:Fe-S-cluster containining protein
VTDRALRMLYREVPEVKGCKAGCGKCCGPVPWTPAELARVTHQVPPGTERVVAPGGLSNVLMLVNPATGACAMLDAEKRCTVYERRPLMCRIFAAADDVGLQCPFGARAGRPLKAAKARALTDRYQKEARDA